MGTSITSLSGGKTSSYMALKYPTDKNIFALIKTHDTNAISNDKGLIRAIKNKIPDFVASRELDSTLKNILDLEQTLGNEIIWVSADETFEQLIDRKKMLPNWRHRFCTTELKIKPIFEYCFKNFGLVVMNIGFRYDERNRAKNLLANCDKAYYFKHKGKKIEWRIPNFPLIENFIEHHHILNFFGNDHTFPAVSNCDFCFFHKISEQLTQYNNHPERIKWWREQEIKTNHTFAKNYSFLDLIDPKKQIQDLPLFSACSCTD